MNLITYDRLPAYGVTHGETPLVVCSECAAVVPLSLSSRHTFWHQKVAGK